MSNSRAKGLIDTTFSAPQSDGQLQLSASWRNGQQPGLSIGLDAEWAPGAVRMWCRRQTTLPGRESSHRPPNVVSNFNESAIPRYSETTIIFTSISWYDTLWPYSQYWSRKNYKWQAHWGTGMKWWGKCVNQTSIRFELHNHQIQSLYSSVISLW